MLLEYSLSQNSFDIVANYQISLIVRPLFLKQYILPSMLDIQQVPLRNGMADQSHYAYEAFKTRRIDFSLTEWKRFIITKTRLFKYIENFTSKKLKIFR